MRQRTALVSVFDKTGLGPFAESLARDHGFRFVSTGGTAKALRDLGLDVTEVSDVTGFPEIMDGRVKTLHPKIAGGILARRDSEAHMASAAEHDIPMIDLVVVNLYPFEETVARGASEAEVIEMIDIGGPSLIRAAAKNHQDVLVVTDPRQYDAVLTDLAAEGGVALDARERLAHEAFSLTARYDAIIDQYFRRKLVDTDFPAHLTLSFEKIQELRYGENSHQRAAFYHGKPTHEPCVVNGHQLHGKELSYNNILDTDTSIEAVKEFQDPAVVIVKHATPCGIATGPTLHAAYLRAYETDTASPFGGIVALNREVDGATAEELGKLFLEVVAAPLFSEEALAILTKKKNVRLLEVPGLGERQRFGGLMYRSVVGGILVQDRDILDPDTANWKVVTKVAPTPEQLRDMEFAFKCVRHVRSNSVVFAKDGATVAIGGGQTSRVDSTWIATKKGGETIPGSVLASDAFFPFRDGIDVAREAGVAAIVQPGGSIRDAEVIAAADEHGIAMVFTGQRSFRH